MKNQFDIQWVDRGRPPQSEPNPSYPDGIDLDASGGAKRTCLVQIPYPSGHINVGTWNIRCSKCKLTLMVTAASRPDDPRSVKVACKL